MKSDLLLAVTQLAAERSLPPRVVVSAIQDALAAAYKRDNAANGQEVEVIINTVTGDVSVYTAREVVQDEDIEDETAQIPLHVARETEPGIEVGKLFRTGSLEYQQARITAQATRQMVLQRLRDAQREVMFDEYSDTMGTVINAKILRVENRVVKVDLGKGTAIMPPLEQAEFERYRTGQQLKVYVVKVSRGPMGPEIIVSRSHHGLLMHLFRMEVPEINSGVVEIKAIAREAGSRSKVAVASSESGVDPVGACVGLRGIRIQSIGNELLGEKIDVVEWSEDAREFIANALSPASVISVALDENKSLATVTTVERQLSLAIGREGQNARLAAKLTNWSVEIVCEEQPLPQAAPQDIAAEAQTTKSEEDETKSDTRSVGDVTRVETNESKTQHTYQEKEKPDPDSEKGKKDASAGQPDLAEHVESGYAQEAGGEDADKDVMASLRKELEELEQKASQRAKPKKEDRLDVLDISSDEIWHMDYVNQAKNEESTLRFAEDIEGFRQGGDKSVKPKPQRRKPNNMNKKSRR